VKTRISGNTFFGQTCFQASVVDPQVGIVSIYRPFLSKIVLRHKFVTFLLFLLSMRSKFISINHEVVDKMKTRCEP